MLFRIYAKVMHKSELEWTQVNKSERKREYKWIQIELLLMLVNANYEYSTSEHKLTRVGYAATHSY